VWLYHVFSLSLRDVELILAERGVVVTHESIRAWCKKFATASTCPAISPSSNIASTDATISPP
jgi:transposase-like protein